MNLLCRLRALKLSGLLVLSVLNLWDLDKAAANETPSDGSERLTVINGLSWSPDGTEFVFATNRGQEKSSSDGIYLWRVQADGKKLTQITFSSEDKDGKTLAYKDANPVWSPDGSLIAFDSDRGEVRHDDPEERLRQVFFCDRDGKNIEQISTGQGWINNEQPTWSPKGDFLSCVTDRNASLDIMLLTPRGKELRYLAVDSKMREVFPSWSWDGKHILFIGSRARVRDYSTESPLHIYLRGTAEDEKPQSTTPKLLVEIPQHEGLIGVCSPINDTFAFLKQNQLNLTDIWVMKLDGTDTHRVTNLLKQGLNPNYFVRPTWSPRGDKIAFVDRTKRKIPHNVYEECIWTCKLSDGSVQEIPLPLSNQTESKSKVQAQVKKPLQPQK